jgi:NHLM bacteriocin system ABC transporter ATP-binding protein
LTLLRIESLTNNGLQLAVWDWLLRLQPNFFRQFMAGDLVRRVLSIRQIHQKLNGATQRTFLNAIFALLNLGLMLVYSPFLAGIGIVIAVTITVGTLVTTIFSVSQSRKLQTLEGITYGLAVQLINSVAKLRVAMAEERAFAVWARQYSQRLRLKAKLQTLSDRLSIVNEGLPLLGTVLLFGFALPLLQSSEITTGTFLAFFFAFTLFLKGTTDLSNTLIDLSSLVPTWERLKPILQAPLEVDSSKTHPGQLSGRFALENVYFRYHDYTPLILNNISLNAEPGEFIAIVGPSGSGKSTILRLLLGFEAPLNGRILYDNKDMATLDLQAVRRSLGVVLQNGQITAGSIFDNISGGALASLEDVWKAAKMAGMADDIAAMPMEMHTIISEGGSNLSGGQRQRLLIARALVSSPKILLMDEATSALDNRTQAIVTQSLKELNITRIVIAHRLSTIQDADRIYVVEAGRIIQSGTFVDLIKQDGLFARLAARQR